MSNPRSRQRSFGGGEVTPEAYGRIEDAVVQVGLAACRNYIVLPHGPATNRTGSQFVREVKDSTKATRVIPFTYSTTQTMAIEIGAGYFRFHTQGATLLAGTPAAWSNATAYVLGDLAASGGVNYYCILAHTNQAPPNATYWYALPASGVYEIPNTYAEADLFSINYVQSADVLTLTHKSYPVAELRRLGATKWTWTAPSFAAPIAAPTGVSTAVTNPSGAAPVQYWYVVTAVGSNPRDESVASSAAVAGNWLPAVGSYNTISWTGVAGASYYNVYRAAGGTTGVFGFIGRASASGFVDDDITPDISIVPPTYPVTFSAAGDYPAAVTYYDQRRVFGGSTNSPQNIWATKIGTENNLGGSIPVRDDDAINYKIAAREANTIRHLVPAQSLLALTSSTEWRVTTVNSDALTPTTFAVRPQSAVGASTVQPLLASNNVLFTAERGGHVWEMGYDWRAQGYLVNDLCLRSAHLFDGLTIADAALVKSPTPCAWFVSSSGYLLGLTYVPGQQVAAWHRHDTDGIYESVCAVAEGVEDAVYCIVRRTINSVQKRYVERFAFRHFATAADAFFVDCGLTYSGAPVSTIGGLSHLEGKVVNILADGAVHAQRTVSGGVITLDAAASKVQVGLPITADLQTLPLAFEAQAAGQGRPKNVNKVWLRVATTAGVKVGPDTSRLVEAPLRTTEPYGTPPALRTGEIEVNILPSWTDGGQVWIRHTDPTPITVLSYTCEFSVGG